MKTDRRTLLAGLGALGVMACTPSVSKAAPFDTELALGDLEARHGGRLGVCGSNSQGRVFWRADERFGYCSTFKLFLAAATLERAQHGDERLDRAIRITAADMLNHAPVTQPAIGKDLTIEQLCQAAVGESDNPAANILTREMGGLQALSAYYVDLGDRFTRFDRPEPHLNTALADDPRDTTGPAQTVRNLAAVFQGERLTVESLDLLEGWMVASTPGPNRMKAGVPEGWRVAHKTGTGSNGATNDIGILSPADGEPILAAVYFTEAPDASMANREAVIAEATRRLVASFSPTWPGRT